MQKDRAEDYLAPRGAWDQFTPHQMAREAAIDFMVELFAADLHGTPVSQLARDSEIEYWSRPTGDNDKFVLVLKNRRPCPSCNQMMSFFVIGKERAACKKCSDFKDCGDLDKAA